MTIIFFFFVLRIFLRSANKKRTKRYFFVSHYDGVSFSLLFSIFRSFASTPLYSSLALSLFVSAIYRILYASGQHPYVYSLFFYTSSSPILSCSLSCSLVQFHFHCLVSISSEPFYFTDYSIFRWEQIRCRKSTHT